MWAAFRYQQRVHFSNEPKTQPRDYIDQFPLEHVGEFHLGGHDEDEDETGAMLLIDSHGREMAEPVWELFKYTLSKSGPRPSLIEWDANVPQWPQLAAEAVRAALGTIGFIIVQSLTDIYGHMAEKYGTWFGRFPDGVIMNQRLFWITVLLILVIRGGGPLSVDRLLCRNFQGQQWRKQTHEPDQSHIIHLLECVR